MNWEKLKDLQCAKCGAKLLPADFNDMICCSKCDFMIGQQKFEKIVNDMYKPKPKRCATFEENLGELNNYGSDFSEEFGGNFYDQA